MKKHNKFKNSKKITKTNEILLEATLQFLTDYAPIRLSRNLRKLLLDYVSQNRNYLPLDFDLLLNDFIILFDFLDVLEDQYRNNNIKKL